MLYLLKIVAAILNVGTLIFLLVMLRIEGLPTSFGDIVAAFLLLLITPIINLIVLCKSSFNQESAFLKENWKFVSIFIFAICALILIVVGFAPNF